MIIDDDVWTMVLNSIAYLVTVTVAVAVAVVTVAVIVTVIEGIVAYVVCGNNRNCELGD